MEGDADRSIHPKTKNTNAWTSTSIFRYRLKELWRGVQAQGQFQFFPPLLKMRSLIWYCR
jgi:hypothetical protein